ncbi:cupredoxin family copper-binding protein [Actinophytocola sp.]|uniref:cupredoxin domain-containing protein n=1 Tax=Actinophytocola sp. TaxID=1872138 RepID=UPI002ED1EEB1
MDSSDNLTPAEEREPPAPRRRNRLLPLLALVAMAGFLIALSALKSAGPADVDLAAANEAHAEMAGAQEEAPAVALPGVAQAQPAAAAPAAAPSSTASSSTSVDIMNYAFSPANLTISVGDTVVWTNHDTAPHNVVVSDGPVKFTSPTLNQGDTFTYTFTVAGTYDYYCSIHPDMKASITVEGGSDTPAPPPPSEGSGCVSSEVLSAFMAHVQAAHLERSPFEQVTDILAIDQYVLTHTVWLEQVLKPVYDGTADQVVKDTLAPIIAHIEAAHLERSPLQQVDDILATDQYILTHTVWLEQVLAPAAEQLTC